jgi:hypothetical protein
MLAAVMEYVPLQQLESVEFKFSVISAFSELLGFLR